MFIENQVKIAKEHGLEAITKQHAEFLLKFVEKERIFRCPMQLGNEESARKKYNSFSNTIFYVKMVIQ